MKWPSNSHWEQLYWKHLQANDVERAGRSLQHGQLALQTRNYAKQTPLQWAALEGQSEIFHWLISQGAKDTFKPAGQAFFNSCLSERSDYAKTLLSTPRCLGSLANIRDEYQDNIFHAVFHLNDPDVLNMVLDKVPVKKALSLFKQTNDRGLKPLGKINSEVMMDAYMAFLTAHQKQHSEEVGYLQRSAVAYCFDTNSTAFLKGCFRHYRPGPAETAHFLQQSIYSYRGYNDPQHVIRFFSTMLNKGLILDETLQALLTERLEQRIQSVEGREQLQTMLQMVWDKGHRWSTSVWGALNELSPEITAIFEQQKLQENLVKITQDVENIESKKNVKRL